MKTQRPNARNRALFAAECFGNAQTALGTMERGCHKFIITRGQFGMIDLILSILDQVGPSHVTAWVWSIADWEIQTIEHLIADRRVLSADLLIDYASITKKGATIKGWIDRFGPGSVKFIVNHAKIVRIWNDDGWKICMRGSCNLNYNPRFEQVDIDDCSPAFDLVAKIEDEIPRCDGLNGKAVYAASGLGRAYEGESKSKLFGKLALWDQGIEGEQLKTWKP